ncbi:MAG: hypothetical protein AB8I08_33005 [Sandaracinaceae bacterium]
MTQAQTLTQAQYRALCAREGAEGPHRASTRSQHVYYLRRRNMWMTARAARGGVMVRFYGRCPCEDG